MLRVFLVALVILSPSALADETLADCEEDQPWLGHPTTALASAPVEGALTTLGIHATACDGEHWDGQRWGPDAYDPNDASGGPLDPVMPATGLGTGSATQAYAAAGIPFAARAAVYAGACEMGEGLEGEAECRGSREVRVGVYVRDDTPGNVVATLVTCSLSITGCFISDVDCDHATYEAGRDGSRTCDRDNNAFSAMLVLP